jgi:hypothetical protein
MARVCIFCGKQFTGQKKNREHIISGWLVEEADLRKRTTRIDFDGRSFDAAMHRIVADSCAACNEASSATELAAKDAYVKIKNATDLAESDAHALLDWLDKTRVGLWLWTLSNSCLTKIALTLRSAARNALRSLFTVINFWRARGLRSKISAASIFSLTPRRALSNHTERI